MESALTEAIPTEEPAAEEPQDSASVSVDPVPEPEPPTKVEFEEKVDLAPMMKLAASVIQRIEDGAPSEITLTNGIKLAIQGVPPLVLRQAAVSIPTPVVPINLVDGREVENPNDPSYIRAVNEKHSLENYLAADAMMMVGTRIEYVPDNVCKPEDDEWFEPLEAIGITVPHANKYERYLSWLRFYALCTDSDLTNVMGAVIAFTGVSEVEVARAAAGFRRVAQW